MQEGGQPSVDLDGGNGGAGAEQASGQQPQPRPDLEDMSALGVGGGGIKDGPEHLDIGKEVLREPMAGPQSSLAQRGPHVRRIQ